MNGKLLLMAAGLTLIFSSMVLAQGTWDNHKMHFPQLPDEDGWDVHVDYPMFLADDWTCSETGPVTDIHWWGSWLDGAEGVIDQFVIKIWANVEEDPTDPTSYSHPGAELHTIIAPPGYFTATPIDPSDVDIWQGWYDPSVPYSNYPDHQQYFQYDLILNEQDWFIQVEGTVYWISIECLVEDIGQGNQWGWKNTESHHLDDAVFGNGEQWTEIFEPGEELSNTFYIMLDENGNYAAGYADGNYIDPTIPGETYGWYKYEEIGSPFWWNIWFYDHPLNTERIKDIRIEYNVDYFNYEVLALWVDVTANWATDLWTNDGMPAGDARPPMPYDFDYTTTPPTPPESDWIGRGNPPDSWGGPILGQEYNLRIFDYNPEWVSVDVRGYNALVEGTIYHTCRASLDLAFVITGGSAPEPEGACCYYDAGTADMLCIVTTYTDCESTLGGTYIGDATSCSGTEACCMPDGTCQMVDAICCVNVLGGFPQGPGTTCLGVEACCLSNGTCTMADALCCVNELGGTPQGSGTTCTAPEGCCMPNGDCSMLDPLCCIDIGGTPQGPGTFCTNTQACCMPNGYCENIDPLCCDDLGGTSYSGFCSQLRACCLPDNTCEMLDPLCCYDLGGEVQPPGSDCQFIDCNPEPTGACCYTDPPAPDLYCTITTQSNCEQTLGGTFMGEGTVCQGIEACCLQNGDCIMADALCCTDIGGTPQGTGTDCESVDCTPEPYTPKNWYQPPDLSQNGIDINASYPLFILADDFECTETAPIQEIHIWGSWRGDVYPGGDPSGGIDGDAGDVSFRLSLYADSPAGVLNPWSSPAQEIASWVFEPFSFIYKAVKLEGDYEGWMDPPDVWQPSGDQNCWEYIFQFDENNWFIQEGTAGAPVIYWLSVQAFVSDPQITPAFFGWKTSVNHWNDDAVWFEGAEDPAPHDWFEMRYPIEHPFETESIDQAFLIGGPCDCYPGEADFEPAGAPVINILDVVYIINYKYKGGPAPVPYELCSGDANCDCAVNILDVVYIINYKYKFGPAPCTCGNFIADCPGGLR